MPPCEALTTTAPRASASATRVMLSAMTIGAAEEGIAWGSQQRMLPASCRQRRALDKRYRCVAPHPTAAGAAATLSPQAGRGFCSGIAGTPSPRSRGEGWGEGPDWLALPLGGSEEGGGAVFDAALDCLCEQVQEARQFEIDPDKIIIDLDATGDRLHHCDDPEIEAVIVPGIVERFDVGPYFGADRGEPLVDAPLGPVAAQLVRDRDGDRVGAGQHMGGNIGVADRAPARFDAGRTSHVRDHSRVPALKVRSEIAGSVWKIEVAIGDSVAEDD